MSLLVKRPSVPFLGKLLASALGGDFASSAHILGELQAVGVLPAGKKGAAGAALLDAHGIACGFLGVLCPVPRREVASFVERIKAMKSLSDNAPNNPVAAIEALVSDLNSGLSDHALGVFDWTQNALDAQNAAFASPVSIEHIGGSIRVKIGHFEYVEQGAANGWAGRSAFASIQVCAVLAGFVAGDSEPLVTAQSRLLDADKTVASALAERMQSLGHFDSDDISGTKLSRYFDNDEVPIFTA